MKKILLPFVILCSIAIHAQSTNPAPYCNASFDDQQGFPVDDHIDRVSFGTLNNVSNAQYPAPHFVFYNNLTTHNFAKGSSYTLKVKFTVAGGAGYGVWIDYNHNNIFDSNEKVAGTSGTSYLALQSDSISLNVAIPSTALTGNTRMRVRIVEDDNYHLASSTSELACNIGTTANNVMDWGETEDYTINITSPSGVDEITSPLELSIYPNPASDVLSLQMADPDTKYSYSIRSILGQTLIKNSVLESHQTINVSSLIGGLYLITIVDMSDNREKTFKFIKR